MFDIALKPKQEVPPPRVLAYYAPPLTESSLTRFCDSLGF